MLQLILWTIKFVVGICMLNIIVVPLWIFSGIRWPNCLFEWICIAHPFLSLPQPRNHRFYPIEYMSHKLSYECMSPPYHVMGSHNVPSTSKCSYRLKELNGGCWTHPIIASKVLLCWSRTHSHNLKFNNVTFFTWPLHHDFLIFKIFAFHVTTTIHMS